MGEMAVTAEEQVAEVTDTMTNALYAALEAIDAYKAGIEKVIEEQSEMDEPNSGVIKRMKQFVSRAESMNEIIEDQVLDHLNFCNDRVFSVGLAERGEFI